MSYSGKAEWEIIHWPIKCRGNFIRLVFAECNVPFKEISGWDITPCLVQSPMCGSQQINSNLVNISMAPPYIRKIGDVNNTTMISQCVIATQYLSNLYGLRPKSDLYHAQCGMIVANCNDAFTDVYTNCGRLKMGKVSSEDFINTFFLIRFQKWLEILEHPLKREKNQTYYFENKITQSDLACYNVMEGFNEWLGDKLFNKYVLDKHETLKKHYFTMQKTSKGIKLLKKQQDEIGFKWWPYHAMGTNPGMDNDGMNIIGSRKFLLKSNL